MALTWQPFLFILSRQVVRDSPVVQNPPVVQLLPDIGSSKMSTYDLQLLHWVLFWAQARPWPNRLDRRC
jgi:hypothetical protein